MPSKLQELNDFIAAHFHEGATPEAIEREVKLQSLAKEALEEESKNLEATKKINDAYRELVQSMPGKIDVKGRTEDSPNALPDFEVALNNVAKGKDIYGQPIQK